jgi:integrase
MGKLTALKVKSLTAPGRYVDGDGLMLVVKASGARSWLVRLQKNGKRRDIGLGSASVVSLAEARLAALETRKQLQGGIDPVAAKRALRVAPAAPMTFRDAAIALHNERKADWINVKHRAQWISTLETYAFPTIGDRPIAEVTGTEVRDLLVPIWQTKAETARRVLQRVGKVLDWSHVQGHRPAEAPMRSIRSGLARQTSKAEHFASLPPSQVPLLMEKLRSTDTAGRLALRFLILTAARSGEVRGATWDEVDMNRSLWTVPAERMKAKRQHDVPLSFAALAVLARAQELRKGLPGEPIFPGQRHQALSDMTLAKVLRTSVPGEWTVHGFRSTFRDWVAESTSFSGDVAEAALAHTIANKVEAAYRRTNYLDKRRELMAAWSIYADPAAAVMPAAFELDVTSS